MFICESCGRQSAPGEKSKVLTTEYEEKTYYDESGRKVGEGWQITKSAVVDQRCFERYEVTL